MGTIDSYLAELDPADAALIALVYDVARETVPEAEQGTCYGMPTLMYRGKGLLAVMRTKKHIGLYPNSGRVLSSTVASSAPGHHTRPYGTSAPKIVRPRMDGRP